jgi:heme/copper-type cytochrome/quinol oxidase subunit 3
LIQRHTLQFQLQLYSYVHINDLYIESFLSITLTEQLSLIYGIKLLIISELMLFVACFWSLINFKFISNAFALFFSFPLLSCYAFSIPFSNLCILLFSSLPLQSAQIFIKIGCLNSTIESIAQSLSCGLLFMILQLK